MKKPGTILALQIMSWFVLTLLILITILNMTMILVEGPIDSTYEQFRQGYISSLESNLDIDVSKKADALGYLSGLYFVAIIQYSLTLTFIKLKKFKSLLTMLIINVVVGFSTNMLAFIYSIVMLVIFLSSKKAKKYVKGTENPEETTLNAFEV